MRITATIVERPGPRRPGMWVGFLVPDEVMHEVAGDLIETRKRIPVAVSMGATTYCSSVTRQPDGWEFIASLNFREATGTALGDTIEVDLEHDTRPREVTVPADVEAALTQRPGGMRAWEALTYSHQREYLLYVEDAKKPETRARRIEQLVEATVSRTDGRGSPPR